MLENHRVKLSIIVLNWNRETLLRGTVLSILANTRSKFELFIIDNGSTDNSRHWLSVISKYYPNIEIILLDENIGGEAFNIPLDKIKGEFVCFSENDLEYLPGWDLEMLNLFSIFPELGQLSPFSPFPQKDIGEVWTEKPYTILEKEGTFIYRAEGNIGSSCMVPTTLIKKGLRWKNLKKESDKGTFYFPADADFSDQILRLNKTLAWSKQYQAINWGHNSYIWKSEKSNYYLKNWSTKSKYSIDGLTEFEQFADDKITDSELRTKYDKLLIEYGLLLQGPDITASKFKNLYCQMFYDVGLGFSEERSSKIQISTEQCSFTFEVDPKLPIKTIRIDPLNTYCVIRFQSIKFQTETGEIFTPKLKVSQSSFKKNDVFHFPSLDPIFYFNEVPSKIKMISIDYEILLFDKEALIYIQKSEINRMKNSQFFKTAIQKLKNLAKKLV